ncbi:MAG: haloacid dehalogenase-like hydrolase [Chthoniobacterales bacterium]|nr:haloacid dehalogenase-like hydrolase [Chthoniobacterales bacterium]
MPKRLLLWDIDATLITTGRAGERALRQIVRQRYGAEDDLRDIEIAGRTDRAIVRSILQKYGFEGTAEEISPFLEEYLQGLSTFLPQLEGRILPGVEEILKRLHPKADSVLALLTGNLRRGAQLKLQHYGLWHYFEFGAFADDHHDRNELGAFARRRAQETHGHGFDAAFIDVIGDTGHDIACGKIFGARTIAVATGSWTREQLAAHTPDFLFDDLSQVDDVMATLGW